MWCSCEGQRTCRRREPGAGVGHLARAHANGRRSRGTRCDCRNCHEAPSSPRRVPLRTRRTGARTFATCDPPTTALLIRTPTPMRETGCRCFRSHMLVYSQCKGMTNVAATAESNDSTQEWRKVTFGSTGILPLCRRAGARHNERTTATDAIAEPIGKIPPTRLFTGIARSDRAQRRQDREACGQRRSRDWNGSLPIQVRRLA